LKILGCDPGKHDIAFITDGVQSLRYTKGQRLVDTYSSLRTKESIKKRKHHNIDIIESTILSEQSKKSCILENFKKYIITRRTCEEDLQLCYEKSMFRQFKFLAYCKTISSEDKFANKVFKTFKDSNVKTKNCTLDGMKINNNKQVLSRSNIMIGWGNWGRTPNTIKGVCPTPGIGFRKSMERYFKTITINEAYTSKICPCCGEKSLKNPEIGEKNKEKHHLLRCTNEECYSRWWNRNIVGSYNILYNTLEELTLL
jgi:hypothetical protein